MLSGTQPKAGCLKGTGQEVGEVRGCQQEVIVHLSMPLQIPGRLQTKNHGSVQQGWTEAKAKGPPLQFRVRAFSNESHRPRLALALQ